MTRYEARFSFGAELAPEGAAAWVEQVRAKLPEGATVELMIHPLVLDIGDVTEEHAGNPVMIRGYYRKVGNLVLENAIENLHGTLDHVFVTGDHPTRKTLIIDSKAYDVPAYSLVEIGEW